MRCRSRRGASRPACHVGGLSARRGRSSLRLRPPPAPSLARAPLVPRLDSRPLAPRLQRGYLHQHNARSTPRPCCPTSCEQRPRLANKHWRAHPADPASAACPLHPRRGRALFRLRPIIAEFAKQTAQARRSGTSPRVSPAYLCGRRCAVGRRRWAGPHRPQGPPLWPRSEAPCGAPASDGGRGRRRMRGEPVHEHTHGCGRAHALSCKPECIEKPNRAPAHFSRTHLQRRRTPPPPRAPARHHALARLARARSRPRLLPRAHAASRRGVRRRRRTGRTAWAAARASRRRARDARCIACRGAARSAGF
ncbi:hypothetical protein PsYK624_135440 [Phanerochaete sordida]|uniref:Uncharacterized protein n=1 Tax=Phanerochaete sordida TaxID=48140 RepID=A0A9P3GLU9_9APHY|nr:hypothetical protein PsYK624_135440 [Phanerochaete sordida]